MPSIRAKAVCVFRRQDTTLLCEDYDPFKDEHYLTPIGGGIEFGETSEQAARREIREEIGTEIDSLTLLGVLENLFTFEGKAGHEIVFVYEASFADSAFFSKTDIQGVESNGAAFKLRWFSQAQVNSGALKIYPAGLTNIMCDEATQAPAH